MRRDADRYDLPKGKIDALPNPNKGETPGVISAGTVGFSGEGNFGFGIPHMKARAIPGEDGEGPATGNAMNDAEARAAEERKADFMPRARNNLETIPAQKADLETFDAVVKEDETEEGLHNKITVDGMGDKDRYK
ncbi:hypothetical protein GTO89_13420 [Heliobacterium gestii]|uniref:Uncharacterized protein n=1 Tax=Heliomicrobium gestii TaxID=2699 RepID=A0A845LKW6_HELGE|nr:hypothetical protein [Heliomicrobium gestii]MBM7867639.1 hypothetical protein [Heliomicrobium gestii]MZP44033.1 hypothetical protein [Heliomicrobium gestii]